MCSRAWDSVPKTYCRICGKLITGISDICEKCKAVEEALDEHGFADEENL